MATFTRKLIKLGLCQLGLSRLCSWNAGKLLTGMPKRWKKKMPKIQKKPPKFQTLPPKFLYIFIEKLINRSGKIAWKHSFKEMLANKTRAFHKLHAIFQKVCRNFSKSRSKVAFCHESCSKVARKNKNFCWSDVKICKLFNKVRFLSIFVKIWK